jgi:hypothetical protein
LIGTSSISALNQGFILTAETSCFKSNSEELFLLILQLLLTNTFNFVRQFLCIIYESHMSASCITHDLLRTFYDEGLQDSSSEASQEILSVLQRSLEVVSLPPESSQIEMCNDTCAILLNNEALIKAIGWDLLHVLMPYTTLDGVCKSMEVLR